MLEKVPYRYLQAMRSYRASPSGLKALQVRRFRRLLLNAYRTVPFYHELYKKEGIDIEGIRSVEDLRRLPLLSKRDLVAGGVSLLRPNSRPALQKSSTGTTGNAVWITWSSEFVGIRVALMLRMLTLMGVRPWTRLVTVWPPRSFWGRSISDRGVRRPSTVIDEMKFGSSLPKFIPTFKAIETGDRDELQDALSMGALHPRYIICAPTRLWRFGRILEREGKCFEVSGVSCANEVVSSTRIRQIERLFRTRVFRAYGSAEFGGMGAECSAHNGIHLNEDFLLFEFLKDGDPVGPGEEAELIVTSLSNLDMPLIRYRLGDRARLGDYDRCECGSSLRRISALLGRGDAGLMTARGDRISQLAVAEFLETRFGLGEYQLIQRSLNDLSIKLGEGEDRDPEGLRRLEEGLSELVGTQLGLAVDELTTKDTWAKFQPVISSI